MSDKIVEDLMEEILVVVKRLEAKSNIRRPKKAAVFLHDVSQCIELERTWHAGSWVSGFLYSARVATWWKKGASSVAPKVYLPIRQAPSTASLLELIMEKRLFRIAGFKI